MKTIKLGQNSFKFYDDCNQLPADRYKEFQKYQLIDSGVGSTMEDITAKLSKLIELVRINRPEDAAKEAENLYYTHYFILEKINPQMLSFACLVHSINDVIVDDSGEDRLEEIIKELSGMGLTQEILDECVITTKKNFDNN